MGLLDFLVSYTASLACLTTLQKRELQCTDDAIDASATYLSQCTQPWDQC